MRFLEVISCPASLILVFELLDCDLKQFMTTIPKEKGMEPDLVKVKTWAIRSLSVISC